ncbi:HK97 family phage prohead protease [Mycolicibacterium hippocampi]|uniref:Major capsid protein n=1 Tax=Mycolicibacterium hippocampi TaxID=659824 RepID=A0A7I9ZGE4_9MYCO|nr:HK97 family phage prohead protease [Mycolicibacterium hippocampi]GFH00014.1 hypothetical protein MHIP_04970 [Mycolicibacterium hippocampi]
MTMATRSRPTAITDAPEHRSIPIEQVELRAADDDTITLTGYASTFEPYEMYGGPAQGGWIEQLDKGAFTKSLREKPDLHLLINHEGMPLARTKSGTLTLSADTKGLKVSAKLDRTDPDVQRLEVKMRRGDLDEMSFAFRVRSQQWSNTDDFPDDLHALRTITEVNLHKGDVSVVNFGANPTTSASVRKKGNTLTLDSALQMAGRRPGDRRKPMSLSEANAANAAEAAKAAAARARSIPLITVREPRTYEKHCRHSYFADLITSVRRTEGYRDADERLRRHATDVETNPEYRDMDRTDGAGGEFVPPTWLVDEYVDLARAGRAYANLAQSAALPPKTDSLKIPKVTSGTATAFQNGDNTAVEERDADTDTVEAGVHTVTGQASVAQQLLDQSPINFDEVIFGDLIADHGAKLDIACLAGSGSNGQVLGVHNTPGIVTLPVGAVTVSGFYNAIADGIQRVHTSRFQPPTHIVMHPRRWGWLTAAVDDDQRPLVLPPGVGVANSLATLEAVGSQRVVGGLQGLPVVTDPNIGTYFGDDGEGGGNGEDVVYVQRSNDLILYEGGIRSRVLPEIKSGTLSVVLQVYSYVAFTAERYPQSIVEITGLTEPQF